MIPGKNVCRLPLDGKKKNGHGGVCMLFQLHRKSKIGESKSRTAGQETGPYPQNNQSKKSWRSGSRSRVLI
jgi:hypothetical protein